MRIGSIFLLLFCFGSVKAQEDVLSAGQKDSLKILGFIVRDNPEFKIRKEANDRFTEMLSTYLKSDEGYEDPMKDIVTMVNLSEEDNDFRIFTWIMRDSSYNMQCYGLVAANTRKGVVVTVLEDQHKGMFEAEYKTLKANNWYGAVYYKMLTVKKGRKKVYTLLGYSPDKPVQRKIVEVISVDKRGKPKFGAKVFYIEDFMDKKFRRPPMRLILSYSAEYSASVKWNEEKEMIIMDHLSPPDPKLKGFYDMYGPDMTYDGLEWDDDWWHLRSKVNFNSGQESEIRPPDRPIGPPSRGGG